MRSRKHFFQYFFPVLILLGIVLLLIPLTRVEKVPLEDFDTARKAINDARISRADLYSPENFRKSENLFDSAMLHWQEENDRFILRRDYSVARYFAVQSARYALLAQSNARDNSRSLPIKLVEKIEFLRTRLDSNQELLSVLPVPDQVLTSLSRGRLKFAEAESAYSHGDYFLCEDRLEEAETSLRLAFGSANELLAGYFQNYGEWQKWVKNTIHSSSRENSYVIIIDKMAREARVYRKGIQVHSFGIELGRNWIGDKRFQGDKATPEGYYTVLEKKKHPNTKYYKALLLDYPNTDDIRRFGQDKSNGTLPGSADIGGHIEIHGEGGRGNDWTDGCIALNNRDMDILYNLAAEGARVTIVGSLKPLEEIWKPTF
jgi:hypothetical protein